MDRAGRTAPFKVHYTDDPAYYYDYSLTMNADADYISGSYVQTAGPGSESGSYYANKD